MEKNKNIEDFIGDTSFQNYVYRINPKDRKHWENRLKLNPELIHGASKAEELLLEMDNQGKRKVDFSIEDELQRLNNAIKTSAITNESGVEIRLKRYLQIAASIIVLLSMGLFGTIILHNTEANDNPVYTEIVAPKGSKAQVTLEDGTKIWLNADSKLKYPSRFTKKERKVHLTGEGYFDVAKEPERPFILMTADVRINVLGTAFNIKSYPDDNFIETTLESGSLTITPLKGINNGKTKQKILLEPKQKVVLFKDERVQQKEDIELESMDMEMMDEAPLSKVTPIKEAVLVENVDTDVYISWKDEKLVFRSEKLVEIVKKMERWYDVNITIEEELKQRVYSGTFQDETVEQALDAICITSNLRYSIEKNNVEIFK